MATINVPLSLRDGLTSNTDAIDSTTRRGQLRSPIGPSRLNAARFLRSPIFHMPLIREIDRPDICHDIGFLLPLPLAERLTTKSLAEDEFAFGQRPMRGSRINIPDPSLARPRPELLGNYCSAEPL